MRKFLKQFAYRLLKCLPYTEWGDRLYAWGLFIIGHRRLPTPDGPLINDMLYSMKISGELKNPLRQFISDKEFVKIFIRATVGDQYNIETFAILRKVADLDTFEFPNRCVIKATHTSGRTILREDGEDIDRDRIKLWLKENYYRRNREANYKYLQPKVIVEKVVFDDFDAADYKFFCWNGVCKFIQVRRNQRHDPQNICYSRDWQCLDFSIGFARWPHPIPRPSNLNEMITVAETLAAAFGFMRVDLYSDDTKIYVGELTNCHGNAFQPFRPAGIEAEISELFFADIPPDAPQRSVG